MSRWIRTDFGLYFIWLMTVGSTDLIYISYKRLFSRMVSSFVRGYVSSRTHAEHAKWPHIHCWYCSILLEYTCYPRRKYLLKLLLTTKHQRTRGHYTNTDPSLLQWVRQSQLAKSIKPFKSRIRSALPIFSQNIWLLHVSQLTPQAQRVIPCGH